MPPAAYVHAAAPHGAGAATTSGRLDPDPLVAARTGFFVRRTGSADGAGASRNAAPRGELTRLLDAEYGPRPTAVATGGPLAREDAAVASLRRACRLAVPLTPEALLAHADGGPRLTAVLAEMWPDTVRRHGPLNAEALLRTRLLAAPGAPAAAFLLDLAVSAGIQPLTAVEAADLAAAADLRAVRHSAWRYLHLVPGGRVLLPGASTAADVYEHLLLAPPRPGITWDRDRLGVVVAQTMLLGGLDTPGQGLGGGLSVLLGGLGDRLAETDGVAGAVTVVGAGHADLVRDPRPAYQRAPGHWVLRLPVDAPEPPQQTEMHAHRPALTWWATRLLGAMPRPLDVVHVRYADDGSLALAEAAARLGARLVFTATPDPHRQLADRHSASDPDDPDAAEALRHDVHRVFVADRLVERADTVVGIPGRGGTEELVRHFPGLARVNGGSGPAAPPEGIAPYRPAPDEEDRRAELLSGLFGGGDRPGTLDPVDRGLPLLLSVGRLHPVKQQDLLVRAWLATGLHESTTLVLIGGGPGEGSAPEAEMRRRIAALPAGHPRALRRLALVPALPNERVRRLQRALADPVHGIRAWYVCPSAKEEFGIAVLEAMEAGLPAAGPLRGGVTHYLRDGANGILLDTSGPAGLAHGLRRLAAVPESDRRAFARAGRALVRDRYSVTGMADALARTYTSLPARRPTTPQPHGTAV
ncbi:glycosyltransferase [Streptomyces sp. NPDC005574]|uniref:glycosyltransferase n=1 Tax=Streptomyces sp. NPDC005574 TaxID=3156891 RepID=UPI0033AFDA96